MTTNGNDLVALIGDSGPHDNGPSCDEGAEAVGDWHMEAVYEQIEELQQAAKLAESDPMEALFFDAADMALWLLADAEQARKDAHAALAEIEAAKNDLRSWMTTFVREHFPHVPQWEPLPDLLGMLSQMDNASTIGREYQARIAVLEAALSEIDEAIPKPTLPLSHQIKDIIAATRVSAITIASKPNIN